ncbi:hypothetical protein HK101_000248 [Irineochytrium annulatum]|nr:hypothetical protein HK101_000248 [Irineochytrium annulatum]
MAECAALVQIYQATGGPNWTTNTGWPAALAGTTSCCEAYGVHCNGAGYLMAVNFENNNLVGQLPEVFESLASAMVLAFGGNKLSGQVPISINSLLPSTHLDLSNNQFGGYVPHTQIDPTLGGNCMLTGNPDIKCLGSTTTVCTIDSTLTLCPALGGAPVIAAAAVGDSGYNGFGRQNDAVFANGQNMVASPVPADMGGASSSSSSSSKSSLPLILGLAGGLLVVGAIVPVAVVAARKRSAASKDAALHLPRSGDYDKVSKGGSWFSRADVTTVHPTKKATAGDKSSMATDPAFATSNVRRFNVDGAYPGMPGYRADEDANRPAFTASASRRSSAVSITSDMSDDSFHTGPSHSRRPSGRALQLNDPIMERASEDLARDLEEAGAARSSASPYGKQQQQQQNGTVAGFFGRLMSGGASRVPTDEGSAASGGASTAVAGDSEEAIEGSTLSGSAPVVDARSMYSHQTRHEVGENVVRRGSSSPDQQAAGKGSYTGFTVPGSSAAKRAANRAKKGRVPNVM